MSTVLMLETYIPMHKIRRVYLYGRVYTLCVNSREPGEDVEVLPLEVLQRTGHLYFDKEGLSSYPTSAAGRDTDSIGPASPW